jgi:hypothetical protein
MSNKQMTAVEWFIEELGEYFPIGIGGIELMVFKAKELEKQQIIDAWYDGVRNWDNEKTAEQYYNETYGGQNNEKV